MEFLNQRNITERLTNNCKLTLYRRHWDGLPSCQFALEKKRKEKKREREKSASNLRLGARDPRQGSTGYVLAPALHMMWPTTDLSAKPTSADGFSDGVMY